MAILAVINLTQDYILTPKLKTLLFHLKFFNNFVELNNNIHHDKNNHKSR